jgi:hypothetical protein
MCMQRTSRETLLFRGEHRKCFYVYVYVHVYVPLSVSVFVCVCVRVCMDAQTYAGRDIYMCTCTYADDNMPKFQKRSSPLPTHFHAQTHAHVHTCTCTQISTDSGPEW